MPGQGDRVCSCHFISGEKSNMPSSPDYVPTVYPDSQCVRDSEDINRQHQRPEEESPDPVHSAILPDLTGFNHDHRLLLQKSSLCVPETSTITCGTGVQGASGTATSVIDSMDVCISASILAEVGK